MANTGCTEEARPLAEKFLRIFAPYDYVVAPSGSCVAMVRIHYEEYLHGRPGFDALKHKTFELCEFLTDVLHVRAHRRPFPASRRPAPELSRLARTAPGQVERTGRRRRSAKRNNCWRCWTAFDLSR